MKVRTLSQLNKVDSIAKVNTEELLNKIEIQKNQIKIYEKLIRNLLDDIQLYDEDFGDKIADYSGILTHHSVRILKKHFPDVYSQLEIE